MIIGNKNSGKSTLSVYLLNKILNYFKKTNQNRTSFYLETDLGQSSFFLPGNVSLFDFKEPIVHNLHTPHIKKPLYYEFIGEYSPSCFTANYLKAV